MTYGLAGKLAIVTGGSSGVGRGIVHVLVREQMRVVNLDTHPPDAHSKHVRTLCCDISDEYAVIDAFEKLRQSGDAPFLLVNNAAVFPLEGLPTSKAKWIQALSVNVVGAALCSREFIKCIGDELCPTLPVADRAVIVNIGSVSSYVAQKNFLVYSTTKAAVVHMARCLAVDLAGRGVRVNAVCPGAIWTSNMDRIAADHGLTRQEAEKNLPNMGREHLLGRSGDPEEVGELVAFLASDRARLITGSSYMIDGGWTAY